MSLPTLRITADGFEARGPFAEAQAAFLQPDAATVARLQQALEAANVGVVAHFYMDPELQGVLGGCSWPHIHVSDSLVMADRAIAMAEAGVSEIAVLGVDFMSENVRAMLDAAGFAHVPVHRVSDQRIGCSLAESAEAPAYGAYLQAAARVPRALHVVYINTSLLTKARAHALVPTITCTSSNVVQTVLQAFAQIPDLQLFFGPDTYMGDNLAQMFARFAGLSDAEIQAIHPNHDRASMARVRDGLHTFRQGVCVVHHMFGQEVALQARRDYPQAYFTAHLEVPGEMFALAAQAQVDDRGVVGSTSDILGFIRRKLDLALATPGPQTPAFVLGTEAGMITPIARHVCGALAASGRADVALDIVFPVASEAVAATGQVDLALVPGVAAGEGCTTAGGCATCPYMKMNNLQALFGVLARVVTDDRAALAPFAPRAYREQVAGRSAAEMGSEPILHMRALQRDGRLPEALVADVLGRHTGPRTDP